MWRFLLNKQKLCLPSVLLTAFSLALLLNVNNPLPHLLQRVSSSDISISWLGCGLRADYRGDGYYSVLTGIGTLFFVFLLIRPQKGLSSVADRWMRNSGIVFRAEFSSRTVNRSLFEFSICVFPWYLITIWLATCCFLLDSGESHSFLHSVLCTAVCATFGSSSENGAFYCLLQTLISFKEQCWIWIL